MLKSRGPGNGRELSRRSRLLLVIVRLVLVVLHLFGQRMSVQLDRRDM
jgi:hypothetical protein